MWKPHKCFARRTLVCPALCILNSSYKTSENWACDSTVRNTVPQEHLSPKATRETTRKSFLTKSYWVTASRTPCPLLRPEQLPGFWTVAVGTRLGWAGWAAAHLLIGTRLFSPCVPFNHSLDILHTHWVLSLILDMAVTQVFSSWAHMAFMAGSFCVLWGLPWALEKV